MGGFVDVYRMMMVWWSGQQAFIASPLTVIENDVYIPNEYRSNNYIPSQYTSNNRIATVITSEDVRL